MAGRIKKEENVELWARGKKRRLTYRKLSEIKKKDGLQEKEGQQNGAEG